MTDKIKFVTSKFSPYGHKVEMALIEKNIPYEKQEVDLSNRPEWFGKDAPLGKVPLLYVGDKILFESTVICEYLEEVFPATSLHSKDFIVKANHRAWMEFSTGILTATFGVIFAQNAQEFAAKKDELIAKINILEKNLKSAPYFDEKNFLLIDICMATSLQPIDFINSGYGLKIFDNSPKVAEYIKAVTTRESLKKALPTNYPDLFKAFLTRKKSYLLEMGLGL